MLLRLTLAFLGYSIPGLPDTRFPVTSTRAKPSARQNQSAGAQAIVSAAQEILLSSVDVAVAGGMENMDLAPYLISRGRWGYRMGNGQIYDSTRTRRMEARRGRTH